MSEGTRRIETARLTLAPTDPDLAVPLWEAVEASLDALRPWFPWAAAASEENTRSFTELAASAWEQGSGWDFTMLEGEVVVGSVSLLGFDPTLQAASLAYWVRSDRAGRGLATEGAAATVGFAFGDLGLHRLSLLAAPANPGSVRVAERVGFLREGLLRDAGWGPEGLHDVYVFGLLRTDPRPGRAG